MSAAVELRGVAKRFGAVAAVRDVSLMVAAGEFLTLLGPSGCGKTTLLRLIAGFESPDAGSVHIAGYDVTGLPPYRRDVNQVFQSYALFPHLTVADNIAFGLRRQGLQRSEIARRVEEAVALVSLGGCESRWPHQLSGGQRQRVALARALAPRPAVLLLDEPLSALDARLRTDMQRELKELQRRLGTTFVLVTHDQEEALAMSDRIALVREGRIEQLATPSELYEAPATVFAAEFVGQTNLLEGRVLAADAAGRGRVRLPEGVELTLATSIARTSGEAVQLCVRPEKVQLRREKNGEVNTWPGIVESESFRGALDHLVVVTSTGLRLRALALNESCARPPLRAGDSVWVSVAPADLRVVN